MTGRPTSGGPQARPDGPSPASVIAADVKARLAGGQRDQARERFGDLVVLMQRRALRVAYHYLRDAADADEAVQDAFLKVFLHIEQYREELNFDVWFTRILVNACLDRLKSRGRHRRWRQEIGDEDGDGLALEQMPGTEPSSERRVLARERWQAVTEAVSRLPERQRLVFMLSHLDERSAAEISAATGMSPATVRVHLFRALRRIRHLLGEHP